MLLRVFYIVVTTISFFTGLLMGCFDHKPQGGVVARQGASVQVYPTSSTSTSGGVALNQTKGFRNVG